MTPSLPRRPKQGEELDANWGMQIVAYLQALTLRSSPGVRVSMLGTGTTLDVKPVRGGGGGSSDHPFKVTDASTEDDALVGVIFGQVNSVTPTIHTDDGDIPLDNDPVPLLAITTSGVIYLEVTLYTTEEEEEADEGDGIIAGQIKTIKVKNAATLPDYTSTLGRITLATVTIDEDGRITALNQSVKHSLGHQRCAGPIHNFWGV